MTENNMHVVNLVQWFFLCIFLSFPTVSRAKESYQVFSGYAGFENTHAPPFSEGYCPIKCIPQTLSVFFASLYRTKEQSRDNALWNQ